MSGRSSDSEVGSDSEPKTGVGIRPQSRGRTPTPRPQSWCQNPTSVWGSGSSPGLGLLAHLGLGVKDLPGLAQRAACACARPHARKGPTCFAVPLPCSQSRRILPWSASQSGARGAALCSASGTSVQLKAMSSGCAAAHTLRHRVLDERRSERRPATQALLRRTCVVLPHALDQPTHRCASCVVQERRAYARHLARRAAHLRNSGSATDTGGTRREPRTQQSRAKSASCVCVCVCVRACAKNQARLSAAGAPCKKGVVSRPRKLGHFLQRMTAV